MLLILKSRYFVVILVLGAITILIPVLILTLNGSSEPEKVNQNDGKIRKQRGAVVTNGHECAKIGGNILRKGGSAADAAIAALFCEGVAVPESSGLGGGFLLTIYSNETGSAESLVAREIAPAAASKDMFANNPLWATKGGLAVAVPGELLGYWQLHQKYGNLNWAELVEPSIELCRKGHLVTKYLAKILKINELSIVNEPTFREIFINPKTGKTWEEGEYIKRPKLAETLETIALEGAAALYNGSLTKQFVQDISYRGGIITEEDMMNYRPVWRDPVKTSLEDNVTVYSSPLPGSGVILSYILNLLNQNLDKTNLNSITNWQRIVESFKFGFGFRSELGDDIFNPTLVNLVKDWDSKVDIEKIKNMILDDRTFQNASYYKVKYEVPEDHGTAHVSVLAPNGDAVSVTSTINLVFGASLRSPSTGIILNDQMDDFSIPDRSNFYDLPPSTFNYIQAGKRPLSSMCPSILLDNEGVVRLIVGAAGGSKIITSVATTIIRNLWFNLSLEDSINESRLHHQLLPMYIQFEEDFDQVIQKGLQEIGHREEIIYDKSGFSAVTAISYQNGKVFGQFDNRRQGSVDLL